MAKRRFDTPLERCPLCNSPRIGPHDRDGERTVIDRCSDCGVMFMNPQYTLDHLDRYYATYIAQSMDEGAAAEDRRRQKDVAFDLVDEFRQGDRFLAAGCGGGLELEIARDRGFEPEGFDIDPVITARVSMRLGLPVHCGRYGDLDLPANSYDCIFADQMLEHPRNPAGYLRLFRALLRPRGVLYLGVPNLASLSARIKTALGKLGLKGRRRGSHYDTDHHLFYYTPRVLQRLLEREFGFEVLLVAGDPRIETSPARYRLARRYPAFCSRLAVVARPA